MGPPFGGIKKPAYCGKASGRIRGAGFFFVLPDFLSARTGQVEDSIFSATVKPSRANTVRVFRENLWNNAESVRIILLFLGFSRFFGIRANLVKIRLWSRIYLHRFLKSNRFFQNPSGASKRKEGKGGIVDA